MFRLNETNFTGKQLVPETSMLGLVHQSAKHTSAYGQICAISLSLASAHPADIVSRRLQRPKRTKLTLLVVERHRY